MAHDTSWGPEYSADASPASVAAGRTSESTIVVTKLSGARSAVKSVRITPPDGFQLTGGSATRGSSALTVTISDNKATVGTGIDVVGASATIILSAKVPCGVAGADAWAVVAHSTYDFDSGSARTLTQDPASDLDVSVARCDLAFDTQPAAAGIDTTVTSVAGNPSGTPIRVQLRDGNGDPTSQSGVDIDLSIAAGTGASGAALSGDTSDPTNSNGIAAFAPRIDTIGSAYRLEASAGSGIGGATSHEFDISGVAVACSGDCSGSQTSGNTGATVNASSTGLLTLSVGVGDVDCNNRINGYYKGTSEAVTFDVTGGVEPDDRDHQARQGVRDQADPAVRRLLQLAGLAVQELAGQDDRARACWRPSRLPRHQAAALRRALHGVPASRRVRQPARHVQRAHGGSARRDPTTRSIDTAQDLQPSGVVHGPVVRVARRALSRRVAMRRFCRQLSGRATISIAGRPWIDQPCTPPARIAGLQGRGPAEDTMAQRPQGKWGSALSISHRRRQVVDATGGPAFGRPVLRVERTRRGAATRRGIVTLFVPMFLLILNVGAASAAAPNNDRFGNARTVAALPYANTVDTTEATRSNLDPDCSGGEQHSVWYRYTPSASGHVRVNVDAAFDASVSVFTGPKDDLQMVACADDPETLGFRARCRDDVSHHDRLVLRQPGRQGDVIADAIVPPTIDVRLGGGTADTRTGDASTRGSVTCDHATSASIQVQVRQRSSTGQIVVGWAGSTAKCDGTRR